ncbi:DnaJ domain-containing protein, partial [Parasphingorhabdus sp.]
KDETPQKRKPRNFELDRARSLLGVDVKADRSAINDAWRERLAEHHPDRGGDEELARQINRARDILLDDLDSQKP